MNGLTTITKNLGGIISKNSPNILTGLGCAGVLSTAILASKASPRALAIIEREEHSKRTRLKNFDKVKLTWKCYLPAGVVGAATISCIIGANTVHAKRNAALASLYAISDSAFREYRGKVVEEIGKVKETKIRDEVAKDHIAKNPVQNGNIIFTGNGNVLCYDKLSDRYFESSHEFIRQKVNDLNFRLRDEMRISLNEFYYEIGLDNCDLGDMVEFNIDKGSGKIDPHYSTQLTHDGRPCLVINMEVHPVYDGY